MPISIKSEIKLPTGEPDAGNLPVRFGGRGSGQSRFPYLYEDRWMMLSNYRLYTIRKPSSHNRLRG